MAKRMDLDDLMVELEVNVTCGALDRNRERQAGRA